MERKKNVLMPSQRTFYIVSRLQSLLCPLSSSPPHPTPGEFTFFTFPIAAPLPSPLPRPIPPNFGVSQATHGRSTGYLHTLGWFRIWQRIATHYLSPKRWPPLEVTCCSSSSFLSLSVSVFFFFFVLPSASHKSPHFILPADLSSSSSSSSVFIMLFWPFSPSFLLSLSSFHPSPSRLVLLPIFLPSFLPLFSSFIHSFFLPPFFSSIHPDIHTFSLFIFFFPPFLQFHSDMRVLFPLFLPPSLNSSL